MLSLAAQMLRFRKGGFVATFVALAAGVAVLMTCALLVESGLRYHGTPQRYARTVAVVADRDLTVTHTTLGEKESTTLSLPERGSVPESLVPRIADLPGVSTAVGERWIPVTAAAAPGTRVTGHGWSSTPLAPYRLVAGAPPRSDADIAVDSRLADAARLRVGDRTEIVTRGRTLAVRISGIVEAPAAPGSGSALFFTDARAGRLDPRPGRFDAIGVLAEPGADTAAVVTAVRRVADRAGATTYTGADRGLAEEPEAAARDLTVQAGSAFGGYAAVVIVFVAASTVGLSVRHRRRELALLRAVAATPGQVRTMILAEVGLLGALAALVGVPAGLAATGWIQNP